MRYIEQTKHKHACIGKSHADGDLRAGDDATLLSVAAALEPVFAPTPPPPEAQPCEGCTPAVAVKEVTWDGLGTPLPTDTTSCYDLVLHGDCSLKKATPAKPLFGHVSAHTEL